MNDSDPPSFNLDELRLLPDWIKQEAPPPSKQYASHEGGSADEGGPRRGGSRPGSFNRDRDGGRGFGGDRRREGGGNRHPGPKPGGRPDRAPRDDRRPAPPLAPTVPAPVRVEFLPDEKCLASINKQIRSTHLAYPLFGLARMFLQEPARHWVKFTLVQDAPAGAALYQLGEEGPVTTDRAILERIAFDTVKENYYTEQTEQKDPPKGNFTNVARNRLSGALLGPTNYHGYQPALRAEYESKFSRRMSFEDYRRNIEVVSDPAVVERWKEEARTVTTISTRDGDPPAILPSTSEARAHFRQHHLDQLLRTGTSFRVHGSVARHLPDPSLMNAIRQAHDTELRYPAQFVQLLRQGLQNAGLHIFKHRKRVVYVSIARPTPFAPAGVVSENVAAILETVRQFPLCTRKVLAEKVLARHSIDHGKPTIPPQESTQEATIAPLPAPPSDDAAPSTSDAADISSAETSGRAELTAESDSTTASIPVPTSVPSPDAPASVADAPLVAPAEDGLAKAKAALASDLRFLVQSGHLIEFHNGTFDLPLPPRAKEEFSAPAPASRKTVGAAPAFTEDAASDTDAEREALTLESVQIVPPDAPRESEPAPSLESGLEQTEAAMISEPAHTDAPGIVAHESHVITPDPVVIGDVESAHPLSPS